MEIGRRQLLFGAAFAGLAAASGEARACSIQQDSPFSRRFWAIRFDRWFAMPRREQRLQHNFLSAVLHGDLARIDALLAPDAIMFITGDGTAHWTTEPQRLNRAQALTYLTRLVNRTGERSCLIHYATALSPHMDFLIDATFQGHGRRAQLYPGVEAWPVESDYGICGEWIGDAWSRRVVFRLRSMPTDFRDPQEHKISTLIWLA